MSIISLRQIIKTETGQDVYRCRECQRCNIDADGELDVPLTAILKMVMFDDDEVLSCRTVWSDRVLEHAAHACKRGLNLKAILLALRSEARRREPEF